jgi:hypothetical protein
MEIEKMTKVKARHRILLSEGSRANQQIRAWPSLRGECVAWETRE